MTHRSCQAGLHSMFLIAVGTGLAIADDPKPDTLKVQVSRPVEREVTDFLEFTGRTQASTHVDIKPRVTGYLMKSFFKEGSEVKAGEVLFEIDPKPYQAEVDLALATLDLAKAQLDYSKRTFERNQAVRKTSPDAISQNALDESEAAMNEAKARVGVAQATLESRKLNLEYSRVTSPINGRIGRRMQDPGNVVKADETVLAAVEDQDPIKLYFDMDERAYLRWQETLKARSKDKDIGGQPVVMGLANEDGFPRQGKIEFVDTAADSSTGAFRVFAVFPNSDHSVRSGMSVRVRLAVGEPHRALLVAARAILKDQGRSFVYVVNDKNVLEVRTVNLGSLQDDGLIAISDGVKADDRVVHTEMKSLRAGATVEPKLVPMPKADEVPEKRP